MWFLTEPWTLTLPDQRQISGVLELGVRSYNITSDGDHLTWGAGYSDVSWWSQWPPPSPASPRATDQSEASILVTRSLWTNQRPVLADAGPVAGIWDRYTIIHWKRPESNSSQTDFWGTFQVYPLKPEPDGSQFIHRPVVCSPISLSLADQQSLLSPPLPTEIWSFTSFTIVWTNSWPGPQ